MRDRRPYKETAPPMFLLPENIRNIIYKLIVVSDSALLMNPKLRNRRCHEEVASPPALTQVCRQARAEVLPIYYGQNVFQYRIILSTRNGLHDMEMQTRAFVLAVRRSGMASHGLVRKLLLCIKSQENNEDEVLLKERFHRHTKGKDIAGLRWRGEVYGDEKCGQLACTLGKKRHFLLDATPFPLLELPPELRNKIYEFAVVSNRALFLREAHWHYSGCWENAAQPALTRVSCQLRSEVLPIFYGQNILTYMMPFIEPEGPYTMGNRARDFVERVKVSGIARHGLVKKVQLCIPSASNKVMAERTYRAEFCKAIEEEDVAGLYWSRKLNFAESLGQLNCCGQLHYLLEKGPYLFDAAPFPLLKLPAELRNRVYDFVLIKEGRLPLLEIDTPQPALSRTSHQLRQETLPIFYSENTFFYHMKGDWLEDRVSKTVRTLQAFHSRHHGLVNQVVLGVVRNALTVPAVKTAYSEATAEVDVGGLVWRGRLKAKSGHRFATWTCCGRYCYHAHFLIATDDAYTAERSEAWPFRVVGSQLVQY